MSSLMDHGFIHERIHESPLGSGPRVSSPPKFGKPRGTPRLSLLASSKSMRVPLALRPPWLQRQCQRVRCARSAMAAPGNDGACVPLDRMPHPVSERLGGPRMHAWWRTQRPSCHGCTCPRFRASCNGGLWEARSFRGRQSGQHTVFGGAYSHNRATVCTHVAHIAALRAFWTDWLPKETPFLPHNLESRPRGLRRLRVGPRWTPVA